ncbi:MAG: AbrB/MazE/SpoVT family DNA-binding domain-containing protein [Patescibacteria group bacterium]
MQQVSIGARYQVVIPKEARKIAKSLKPGKKVRVEPIDEWSVKISTKPRIEEWLKATKGIGKNLWGKDSTKYIKSLRNEWEDRLKKLSQ